MTAIVDSDAPAGDCGDVIPAGLLLLKCGFTVSSEPSLTTIGGSDDKHLCLDVRLYFCPSSVMRSYDRYGIVCITAAFCQSEVSSIFILTVCPTTSDGRSLALLS